MEPGEFFQYNSILATAGFEQGYVKVERVGGSSPYYAYGVINDQANSDGSFVFPVREDSLAGKQGQTLPVIAGAVFVSLAGGEMGGIVIGARTSSPGGGGRHGVFYNGVPYGSASTGSAWIYGLQQNSENRSNLALVNLESGQLLIVVPLVQDPDTGLRPIERILGTFRVVIMV